MILLQIGTMLRLWTILALLTVTLTDLPPVEQSCTWQQTFSDHFNSAELDQTKWSTTYGSGGNGEQQYYAPDAFEFQNGVLRIKADKRSMKGYPYTSGIITTKGIFDQQHGYFKLRAKVPQGQGLWPAFWLLTDHPRTPWEIDVFEVLGHDTQTLHLTNHWPDGKGGLKKNKTTFTGPDYSDDFHIYAVEWNESEVIWTVDYVERFRVTDGIPADPMFLLINLAVGGNWPGNPNASTLFPSYFEIDYVEVYEEVCSTYLPVITTESEKKRMVEPAHVSEWLSRTLQRLLDADSK